MAPRGTKKLSEDDIREAVAKVRGLDDDAAQHYEQRRRGIEYENAALYRGYQVGLDNVDSIPDDEFGDAHNIIGPIIQASVSATLDQIPNVSVPSAKDDEKSRRKAQSTELICKSWTRGGVVDHDELHRCISWAKTTGLAWMRSMWNQELGRELPMPEMLEAQPDDDGMWHEAEEQQFDIEYDGLGERIMPTRTEGEIENTFVPSTDFHPDPAARTEREMRYGDHVILRPLDELKDVWKKDMFGKEAQFDLGAITSAQQGYFRTQLDDMGVGYGKAGANGNTLAQVHFHWERRCPRYPNGRLAIYSGSTILYYGANPLEPTRIPFTPFYGDIMVAGSLYADSVIRRIKGLQSAINHAANKQREILDLNVNAPWLIPRGSADPQQFVNKTGRTILFNRGLGKPEQAALPEIPASIGDFIDQLFDRANKISGYNDVSRGDQAVQGDLSGRAIRMLKANEAALRKPAVMTFQIQFTKMLQQDVYLARQFYDEGRVIRCIGENNAWLTAQFKSEDYDFATDLVPEIFSGAPQNSDDVFGETLELAEAQLLGDTPEAERARAMLGDRFVGRNTFDPDIADRQKARRHIAAVQDNPFAIVEAASFDNHRIAIFTIDEFRKTLEYENLSPYQRQKIDMLCEQHEAYDELQQNAFAQQQQMLAPGGSPPGGTPQGGAPPPGASQPVAPGVESPADGGHSMNGSMDDAAA